MNTNTQFKNLVELTKYFSDEKKCCEHLAKLRWDGTPACPHCGSTKVYKCKAPRAYICGEKGCLSRFSVTTGTFLEDTKIPLSKWFIAMYLCFSHKKGVSSHQLARDLGITQKSAWFILHRIRSFVSEKAPEMLLQNMVEGDECYIGGKEKNRHANKKKLTDDRTVAEKRQSDEERPSYEDKATVLGLVERKTGRAVAKYVTNANSENIHPFVKENVKEGTTLYTDEHYAYTSLGGTYNHETVKHLVKEYVRGDVSTNCIENFWSVLKRQIYGTHHQVSRKHIQKYLDEVSFKYSTRKHTEQERFDKALSLCGGRLKYPQLIQDIKK